MYATACGTGYGLPFAYTGPAPARPQCPAPHPARAHSRVRVLADAVMPVSYMVIVAYLLLRRRSEQMKIADVQALHPDHPPVLPTVHPSVASTPPKTALPPSPRSAVSLSER